MLGMGLSLHIADFTQVFKQPKAALVGISAQLIALPLIAFLVALIFKLPPELAVGLMIIAFSPSGTTSNLFSNLAKGDVALSISLTSIISLITPFTIPLFILFAMRYFMGYGSEVEIPLVKTIVQLLAITVLPVMIGMFVLCRWQKLSLRLEPILRLFSVVFLFFIIVAIIVKNRAEMVEFFIQTGAAVFTLNIIVLGLGYWLAKSFNLSQKEAITIAYEVGIQNAPLALLITGTIIGNSTMMIPAVTYGILMLINGFVFQLLIKRSPQSV